jgi:hypothetical protein
MPQFGGTRRCAIDTQLLQIVAECRFEEVVVDLGSRRITFAISTSNAS